MSRPDLKRCLWCLIYVVSLAAIVFPQSKPRQGWVFGEVFIVPPAREEAERFPFARIVVERDGRFFAFDSNDGAIIDVKLQVGKYRLSRVTDKDGNEFEFLDYQKLVFKVNSKKRALFNIHLKPLRVKQESQSRVCVFIFDPDPAQESLGVMGTLIATDKANCL